MSHLLYEHIRPIAKKLHDVVVVTMHVSEWKGHALQLVAYMRGLMDELALYTGFWFGKERQEYRFWFGKERNTGFGLGRKRTPVLVWEGKEYRF